MSKQKGTDKMIKKNITPAQVVDFLNSLLKVDRRAMECLFNIRIFCNKKMADHPTVQAGAYGDKHFIGFVGILNGLFGINSDGWGCISMNLNEDNKLLAFSLLKDK